MGVGAGERGKGSARGGRGLRGRERWMNPIIPLFSFTALNLSQSREQKKRKKIIEMCRMMEGDN